MVFRVFRESGGLLKKTAKSWLLFELVYRAAALVLGWAAFRWLALLAASWTGYGFRGGEQVEAYLMRPEVLLTLALLAVCFGLGGLAESAALLGCFRAAQEGRPLKTRQMLTFGLETLGRALRRGNRRMFWFGLLSAVFFAGMGLAVLAFGLHLPLFLQEEFLERPWFWVLAGLACLAAFWALVPLFMGLPVFALEGEKAGPAFRRSAALLKGKRLKTGLRLLLWQGLLVLLAVAAAAVLCLLAGLVVKLAVPVKTAYGVALEAAFGIWLGVGVLCACLGAPAVFSLLASLFNQYIKEAGGEEPASPQGCPVRGRPLWKGALALGCAGLLLASVLGFALTRGGGARSFQNLSIHPAVMAHRGSSEEAPENSLPAFEKAMENRADWIELDVHQTRDGVIVVAHDDDLKRIAGVEKNIWEMNYAELEQLDVGSWFSPAYKGLRLATLDEVMKLCKGKMKLNIELKVTGHETDFEQGVLDVVRANGYENQCVLASLNADALKRVRELDESISTLYILAQAPGEMAAMPFADGLSVEANFVTRALVKEAHVAGKNLYAWTVNKEAAMAGVIAQGVDGVITNDPVRARELMGQMHMNGWVGWLLGLLFR